jgi:peptidoglycan/LPS O-acetylase OafA/YrhL
MPEARHDSDPRSGFRGPRNANIPATVKDRVSHIPSLDGLRAVSFLLVFVAHAGLDNIVPGGLGVTIFFFLSGFLITTLMRNEYELSGRVNFKHFWLRRTLRILPPFYLVLIGATLAAPLIAPSDPVQPAAFAARALHFTNYWVIHHGYSGEPPGTGVYWSLAVEEHFYLLFPWIFVGLQRLRLSQRSQAMTLWGICIAALLWRVILVSVFHVSTDRTYMGSDTRLDSIIFGCAIAVWLNPVIDRPRLNDGAWKRIYFPGALMVLLACVFIRGNALAFRETLRYSLQGAALTVLFIAAIRYPNWWPFRWLNWRPIAFLGVLSYSLYLLHFTVIIGVQGMLPAAPRFVQGLVAFAISTALAWLMYITVERPCAKLRKRLHRESPSRLEAEAAVPLPGGQSRHLAQ